MKDPDKIFAILKRGRKKTMLEQLEEYTPFQRLVATILSSRTKDPTTLPIVKKLFEKYKKPEDFLEIKEKELFGIGFYRVKTRKIRELSRVIINNYGGIVPDDFESLVSLPGVGRKTANCVLNHVFRKPAVAVDVHVHRISNRIGWVKTRTPEETEQKLMKVLPKRLWIEVNELLVSHGQKTCLSIRPRCRNCNILVYCDYGRQAVH